MLKVIKKIQFLLQVIKVKNDINLKKFKINNQLKMIIKQLKI